MHAFFFTGGASREGMVGEMRDAETAHIADHVGILPQNERGADANDSPIAGRICVWLTPGIWYSTGSSMGRILRVGSLITASDAASVAILPDPVGPVEPTAVQANHESTRFVPVARLWTGL
jgi:hypothetical protein